MKTHTDYLTFNTKQRQEIIDITDKVEECRSSADIDDGMVLVSAMHISASVFVNDHEPNLWQDILQWLEDDIAPWDPERLPAQQRNRRGQRCGASSIAHDRPRGDRSGHEGSPRSRSVAAHFLWRMGRSDGPNESS